MKIIRAIVTLLPLAIDLNPKNKAIFRVFIIQQSSGSESFFRRSQSTHNFSSDPYSHPISKLGGTFNYNSLAVLKPIFDLIVVIRR